MKGWSPGAQGEQLWVGETQTQLGGSNSRDAQQFSTSTPTLRFFHAAAHSTLNLRIRKHSRALILATCLDNQRSLFLFANWKRNESPAGGLQNDYPVEHKDFKSSSPRGTLYLPINKTKARTTHLSTAHSSVQFQISNNLRKKYCLLSCHRHQK